MLTVGGVPAACMCRFSCPTSRQLYFEVTRRPSGETVRDPDSSHSRRGHDDLVFVGHAGAMVRQELMFARRMVSDVTTFGRDQEDQE